MKPTPKRLPPILFSLVSLALAAGAGPLSAQMGEEGAAKTQAMPKDQLCGLCAEQVIGMTRQAIGVTPELEARLKECAAGAVCGEFTEDETRDLFLKPPDMDNEYYPKKIDSAGEKMAGRVEKPGQDPN
jgi:hypothetical protein